MTVFLLQETGGGRFTVETGYGSLLDETSPVQARSTPTCAEPVATITASRPTGTASRPTGTDAVVVGAALGNSGLLDNFNRANEDPLSGGGNWAKGHPLGSNLAIASNAVISPNGGNGFSYWTPKVFADCEAYLTLTLTDAALNARVLGRWAGSTPSGYSVEWVQSQIHIWRWTAGLPVLVAGDPIPSPPSPPPVLVVRGSGDGLAIRCVGTTIEAWTRQSDAWTLQLTVTDSTYATGYIGIAVNANGNFGKVDEFVGGAGGGVPLVSGMPPAPPAMPARSVRRQTHRHIAATNATPNTASTTGAT